MIKTSFHLSNFGFTFDTNEVARQEVEFHIQSRFQGIHPQGKDYLMQPRYPSNEWQVNGTTAQGARACASVCRGLSGLPNRIDVTCFIEDSRTSFEMVFIQLEDWFKKNKPTTAISRERGVTNLERATFGARTGRFSIVVEDSGYFGVLITFRLRQDKVLQAWDWLDFYNLGESFEESCKNCFAACTNSILSDDFFGLGLPVTPRLAVTKKSDIEQDWWGYLSAVASKIKARARKENSDYLAVESVTFIQEQISKMVEKDAKDLNESAIRDRQRAESKV